VAKDTKSWQFKEDDDAMHQFKKIPVVKSRPDESRAIFRVLPRSRKRLRQPTP
jgi:hypothetical protein